jgi:hypothetical protein
MASSTVPPSFAMLDPAVHSRELGGLRDELAGRFTQASLDLWLSVSAGRFRALEDTFFGIIRWPKSLGRSVSGTLASGFSISGQYHLIDPVTDGTIDLNDRWADLPPGRQSRVALLPTPLGARRHGEQHRAKVLANLLRIQIVGKWTHHITIAGPGYLLPDPLGFTFGSFDGKAIVLDEVTLTYHPLNPDAGLVQMLRVVPR